MVLFCFVLLYLILLTPFIFALRHLLLFWTRLQASWGQRPYLMAVRAVVSISTQEMWRSLPWIHWLIDTPTHSFQHVWDKCCYHPLHRRGSWGLQERGNSSEVTYKPSGFEPEESDCRASPHCPSPLLGGVLPCKSHRSGVCLRALIKSIKGNLKSEDSFPEYRFWLCLFLGISED